MFIELSSAGFSAPRGGMRGWEEDKALVVLDLFLNTMVHVWMTINSPREAKFLSRMV